MRICIVTVAGHGVGGMQDHTRTLARGLVEAGHETDVITTRHQDDLAEEEREGARWHYVDAGPQHAWLPRRDPAWLPRSLEAFSRLNRDRAFDVIHSESTSAIEFVRRGVHRRTTLVAKFHGSGVAHTRAHLRRFRSGDTRTKLREAKGFLWLLSVWFQYGQLYRFRPCVWMVPSQREFQETRRSHLLRSELGHVVPNGIDTRVFAPNPKKETRARLALGDLPLFVCAGRLDRGKGTHHALQAIRLLTERGQAVRLAVVGSGPERETLEALARNLGIESSVVFTGAQPHDSLASYLASADAFLFPTELNEAAGLAPLQALACGTPVIASSVGSVPEMLGADGGTALFVPPGDPAALAAAMIRILTEADLGRTLGENGVAHVHAEYSLEAMIERTVAVYEIARERDASRCGQ